MYRQQNAMLAAHPGGSEFFRRIPVRDDAPGGHRGCRTRRLADHAGRHLNPISEATVVRKRQVAKQVTDFYKINF